MIKTDLTSFKAKCLVRLSWVYRTSWDICFSTWQIRSSTSHLVHGGQYFYHSDQAPERKHLMFSSSLRTVERLMRMCASLVLWNYCLLTFDTYFISKKLGLNHKQDFDYRFFRHPIQAQPIKSHLFRPDLGSWSWQYLCGWVFSGSSGSSIARPSQTLTVKQLSAIHDQTIAALGQVIEKGDPPFDLYQCFWGRRIHADIRFMTRLVKNVYAVVPSLRKSN